MFTFAAALSGYIAFLLKIPFEQGELFRMGFILGVISSSFVIFEPHKGYMQAWFKEKEILDTLYFRELQDKFGGLLYFFPATLLVSLLMYLSGPDKLTNVVFCLIGVGVSITELQLLRNNELILSDRIKRAHPFFTILKDPETDMWSINRTRTELIQSILETLASKNWTSFETIEKNWIDAINRSFHGIKHVVVEFEKFFEINFIFNLRTSPTPLNDFKNQIQVLKGQISIYRKELWRAGYHTTSKLAQKQFNFMEKAIMLLRDTTSIYIRNLEKIIHGIIPKGVTDELRGYLIEATCFEFLEIEFVLAENIRTRKDYPNWEKAINTLKEYQFVSEHPGIKTFFDNLKILVNKLEELGKRTITEEDLEFEEWFEVPDSLNR